MKRQKHSPSSVNVAIVGATGLVGMEFLSLLEERKFPFSNLFLFASDRSVGKKIDFMGKKREVLPFKADLFSQIDIAFFSAGAEIDRKLVPQAAKMGAVCIDNSSAFRMDKGIPLVVPEVNFSSVKRNDKIIANPNCSTIQLVLVLNILRRLSPVASVDVSTYQAVSGAGREPLEEFERQSRSLSRGNKVQYFSNIIQKIGPVLDNGYCEEEMKLVNETRKILSDSKISVSPTAMRVPLSNVHTESVAVTFTENVSLERVKKVLRKGDNSVLLVDEIDSADVSKSNITFVSRLRRDLKNKKKFLMIITADNLRVGAALNGIRIAERILREKTEEKTKK